MFVNQYTVKGEDHTFSDSFILITIYRTLKELQIQNFTTFLRNFHFDIQE